jgi:hypothetical protein
MPYEINNPSTVKSNYESNKDEPEHNQNRKQTRVTANKRLTSEDTPTRQQRTLHKKESPPYTKRQRKGRGAKKKSRTSRQHRHTMPRCQECNSVAA